MLWLMEAQPRPIESAWAAAIATGLQSSVSATRGLAMAQLERLPRTIQKALFEPLGWAFSADMTGIEGYYGSLLTVTNVNGSPADLVRCCDKRMLGEIVGRIGGDAGRAIAAAFGETLLADAAAIVTAGRALAAHPQTEVVGGTPKAPWIQFGLFHDKPAKTTFRSPLSTWGGLEEGTADAMAHAFRGLDESEFAARHAALTHAFEQAVAAGNWLFVLSISTRTADLLLLAVPDFVDRFVALVQLADVQGRSRLLSSLIDAIASALLRRGDGAGRDLLARIDAHPNSVHYTDFQSGLRRVDAALFACPCIPLAESTWVERLQSARTDRELLGYCEALAAGGHRPWLLERAAHDEAIGSPYHRARALAILAVADDGGDRFDAAATRMAAIGSWYEDLVRWLQRYRVRGQAMHHWLGRLLHAGAPSDMHAAAQLFSHTQDSRARRIIATARSECPPERMSEFDRRTFVLDDDRRPAKVDKQMDERLFGQKVLAHDAHPWFD